MSYIRYINYKNDDGTVETVEDFGLIVKGNLDRRTRQNILKEYQLISNNYYASRRASKDYYQSLKDKEMGKEAENS